MKVKTQDYNDFIVVQLQGQLEGDVVELFQNTITNIVREPKAGIVLDMSDVEFIDSRGLEQLLWSRNYCNQNKRQLRLAGLDENCKRILEITRLGTEFDHYAELAQAVKSLA